MTLDVPTTGRIAIFLLLAVAVVSACAQTAPERASVSSTSTSGPALVAVQLDVTGTGAGDITYSTGWGGIRTDRATALKGWRYSYWATASTPIALEVTQGDGHTSSCAVHVDGALRVNADGPDANCTLARS